MRALFLPLVMLSGAGATGSPFDGDWLMEPPPPPPVLLSLDRGLFARGEGSSRLQVPADGRFHRLSPDDYVDEVAAAVIGSRMVRESDRLRGRVVYIVTYTVTPDGRALTQRVAEYTRPDRRPVIAISAYRRAGRPSRGGSLLSGRWISTGVRTSRANLTDRLTLTGDRFSRSSLGGYGYDAVVGGPPVPVRGDAPAARIQVAMPDARTIVERLSLKGATVVTTMALQPDGRTIRVTGERLADHSRFGWTMHKR